MTRLWIVRVGCHPERSLPFAKQTAANEGPMYYRSRSNMRLNNEISTRALPSPEGVSEEVSAFAPWAQKTTPIANRGCSEACWTLPASTIIARDSALSSNFKLGPNKKRGIWGRMLFAQHSHYGTG